MAEGSALCPIEIGGDENEVDIDLMSISTPEEDEKDAEAEPPRKRLHMQGAISSHAAASPLTLFSFLFSSSSFPSFFFCFPEDEEKDATPKLAREREGDSEELVSGV